jgi:hypothetical protein
MTEVNTQLRANSFFPLGVLQHIKALLESCGLATQLLYLTVLLELVFALLLDEHMGLGPLGLLFLLGNQRVFLANVNRVMNKKRKKPSFSSR